KENPQNNRGEPQTQTTKTQTTKTKNTYYKNPPGPDKALLGP
ncbi:33188_t:CDS:1, partial [Racocetra persica]